MGRVPPVQLRLCLMMKTPNRHLSDGRRRSRHGGMSGRRLIRGFTMLELLVVLTMVSIVAAIAIRSVGDTIRRDRVLWDEAIEVAGIKPE